MNFMEAVKVMKEGKTVARKGYSAIKDNGLIVHEDSRIPTFCIDTFEATDWEIVEEHKCKSCGQKLDEHENNTDYCLPCFDKTETLSDKALMTQSTAPNYVLKTDDVKQFIKDIKDILKQQGFIGTIKRVERLAGERLIE